jgi:hypothetical protein
MLPINWLANFKRGGISFELRDNERVEEERGLYAVDTFYPGLLTRYATNNFINYSGI